MQIYQRRAKLLADKRTLLQKELQAVLGVQDREVRGLTAVLAGLQSKLQVQKKEHALQTTSFAQLRQWNDEQKACNWEVKIEELEC